MKLDTHRPPGLVLTDHAFDVPLDHSRPDGERVQVFAREALATNREKDREDLPWLVFLQGGPGSGSPRPNDASGWLGRALEEYRVLLLDQRGTARSSRVCHQTLAHLTDPAEQAAFLKHFRTDSIVRDCELLRHELAGPDTTWSLLGQSYGGFCSTRYLSAAPEGLREVFITGGLPPLSATAEDIYRRTYKTCAGKNGAYYARYPGDVERVREIADHLNSTSVVLPNGDPLSVRKFQSLGLLLGFSDGFETIHYLVEDAFVQGPGGRELSFAFLRGFENALTFDTCPIFSILHEACYTQGAASAWAAERVLSEFPEFNAAHEGPVYFTGEMIYPWMFEEIAALRPLKEAAHLLAADEDWPHLYDSTVLARNEVPAAAAIYFDDMYVEREFSLETASAIRGLRTWVTNEYEHNGLRSDGPRVLEHLTALIHGRV